MGFSNILVKPNSSKRRKSCTCRWRGSSSWVMLRAICCNEWGYLCPKELFKNLCWHIAWHPQENFKHTQAVSKTQQELPTTAIQLSSYPSQLPSWPVQGSHQDRTLYFLSQHAATLQGEVLHAKTCRNPAGVTASFRVKRLASSGAHWGGASQALCSNPPVPFCRCRGTDWFTTKFGARFWIPIIL